ncbi:MAG TPA: LysR substrate-binding domain-containing protein [Candidatus Methylacidiphilales bacterium]
MDRISIRELEYFVAVAEELSFSKAATRLHLSQPPLSRQIKALEEKLGVTLLQRDTQTVTLTGPGTVLLTDARQILRHLDRAAEAAQRAGKGAVERFEIGFLGSVLDDRLSHFLYNFRHAYPEVQLLMRELDAPDLLEALKDKTIDGAFIGTAPAQLPKDFRLILWRMTPVWLVLSKDHRFAKREGVHLRELADDPWILLTQNTAPGFYRQIMRWCQDEGFRPRVFSEVTRYTAALALNAIGDGISLVPDQLKRMGEGIPELRFKRLLSPFAVLAQTFACREDDNSPLLRKFIAMLEREAETEPKEE